MAETRAIGLKELFRLVTATATWWAFFFSGLLVFENRLMAAVLRDPAPDRASQKRMAELEPGHRKEIVIPPSCDQSTITLAPTFTRL